MNSLAKTYKDFTLKARATDFEHSLLLNFNSNFLTT